MLSLHFHHCYHHQLYLYHQGFEADGTEWGWPELHLRPVGRALDRNVTDRVFHIIERGIRVSFSINLA